MSIKEIKAEFRNNYHTLKKVWGKLNIEERSYLKSGLFVILSIGIISIFVLPLILTTQLWSFVDYKTTGAIGDTINGIAGPFIALLAAILTFLAFYIQYKANSQQRDQFITALTKQKEDDKAQERVWLIERFENRFFELIKFHRENVSDLNYKKFYINDFELSTGRKVVRVVFQEFVECYREVKKFSNSINPDDYIQPGYQKKLALIKQENNLQCTIIQMAIIDIAYSIIFFGIGIEGEVVLKERFKQKYNSRYYFRLLFFFKFKPKKENTERYLLWEQMRSLHLKELSILIEEMYLHRSYVSSTSLSPLAKTLMARDSFDKYYGGHQHRLGHYFRHLFQSYKFLNNTDFIEYPEMYSYGKTLRAQLSTYEQALLLVNSISSIGMRWEYLPEKSEKSLELEQYDKKVDQLITRYNLIKNLPGSHLYDIRYHDFYPKVKYENEEN